MKIYITNVIAFKELGRNRSPALKRDGKRRRNAEVEMYRPISVFPLTMRTPVPLLEWQGGGLSFCSVRADADCETGRAMTQIEILPDVGVNRRGLWVTKNSSK